MDLLSRKLLPHSFIFSEGGKQLFAICASLLSMSLPALYAGDVLRICKIIKGRIAVVETAPVVAVFVTVGVLSGFTLLFGMGGHCAASAHRRNRARWAIGLLVFNIFGALAYYLAVYRKGTPEGA